MTGHSVEEDEDEDRRVANRIEHGDDPLRKFHNQTSGTIFVFKI